MTDISLEAVHDMPWDDLEGAYIKVKQEASDPLPPHHNDTERSIEEREGTLVGRGEGQGVSYDTGEKATRPLRIGPAIYLDTPEDTILEVRTDKVETELLEFEPPEDSND